MRMEARISLEYREERKAKAVLEAVFPDNIDAPKSLSIKTFTENHRVITLIRYDEDSFLTFQSTIDDLLSCVSAAEKTISALKG